jgi:hypothetical protein
LADELTREIRDKRIAVARDVIEQLDRQDVPLRIAQGFYLVGPGDPARLEGDLRDHADYVQAHCKACMIGSAFLSYARVVGGVPADMVRSYTCLCGYSCDMRRVMGDVFDSRTLDRLESAFEEWPCNTSTDPDDDDHESHEDACEAAAEFGKRLARPRDIARALCLILISNDGDLVIPKTDEEVPLG